jgi:uncharacterized membrane protein YfcA
MEMTFFSFDLFSLLLLLLLGAVVGILAGLFGVGGGLIIVPVLILSLPLVGVDPSHTTHIAVGTSLATIVVTSMAAVHAHHKRHAVLWRTVGELTPGILLGAWMGGLLAGALGGDLLQRVFGGFALLVGLNLYFGVRTEAGDFSPGPLQNALVGGGIGLISALVGIGGGTMTVPYLHRGGLEMSRAVATSSACGLPIALAGALSFIAMGWGKEGLPTGSSGYVYWPVALIIVASSSLSAPLGATLAHRLHGASLKRGFGIFLLLVGGSLLFG